MIEMIKSEAKERMQKTIEAYKNELSRLCTGTAHASVLDGINVSYYGTPTPINQVANVNAPEARLLVIQPWDKSIIAEIEKAILQSDLGITPSNDGTVIRLPFPQLTKESRQDLAKQARAKAEDAKVRARNVRRDANDDIKKLEKDKEITADDSKYEQDEIQKLTDKTIAEIDKIFATKEKDILEI